MIRRYVDEALHRARYDKLDDGSFCAEVPPLRGVLAKSGTMFSDMGRSRRATAVGPGRGADSPRSAIHMGMSV
jgi:hypothetical protein